MRTLTHFDFARRKQVNCPSDELYNELCDGRSSFNERNDCAVVAISRACEVPYEDAHHQCQRFGRRNRCSTRQSVTNRAVRALGYKLVPIQFGSRSVRGLELELAVMPGNHYIIRTRCHLLAFADGKIQDWTQGRKHRPKQVYRIEKVS